MSDAVEVIKGDCMAVMADLHRKGIKVHTVITDPPYHLTSIVKRFGAGDAAPAQVGATGAYARASRGFMGKQWDGGDIAFQAELWAAVLALCHPGAHLAAFSATRTYHRMACAIEDAGFEVRDMLAWMYSTGFPKSHDIAKAIDKQLTGVVRGAAGAPKTADEKRSFGQNYERRDKGAPLTAAAAAAAAWGTALKPAQEPICLARAPLAEKTVVAQFMATGTGALNVDEARIDAPDGVPKFGVSPETHVNVSNINMGGSFRTGSNTGLGRWPANVVHDGSDEMVALFPDDGEKPSARFFYSAKAGLDDRIPKPEPLPQGYSSHPTVKPVALMRWLVRLLTPPDGLVLDLFAGTGSTGIACLRENKRCILIERDDQYHGDILRRLSMLSGAETPLFGDVA